MTIKNHLDRPGIHVVHDAGELNSIAGGAGAASPGAAELNDFMEKKWVLITAGVLYAFYSYGNATHRMQVRNACRQLARGVNNATRDSLNIIYSGVAAVRGVATWIKNYFTGAATSTQTTPDNICLEP